MNKPKRKSALRFEQFNLLIDQVAPLLPTPAHLAVLICCFRHGRGNGYFRVSTELLTLSVGLKARRIKYILRDLEQAGIIELISEHRGQIPRVYRIAFQEVNGALQCTIKERISAC